MKKLQSKILAFSLATILAMQFFVFVSPVAIVNASSHNLAEPIDTTKPAGDLPQYNAGVDDTIKQYLCTPEGKGTDLYDCIGRLYRFGISFGSIALVFFVVIAGYFYITGGEAAKGKAKNMLLSAFTGMGIILGSFLLLNFINPTLVQYRTIQPPIFDAADLPSCEDIGFGARCIISSGPAAGQVFGGSAVTSGQQIQGNGVSCSLGDDKLASTKAKCSIDSRYQNAINAASQKYGVDKALIKAIIQKESNWKEVITSWTGCCHGLMQIKTETAQGLGCQAGWQTDGVKNIDCGTKYLSTLLKNSAVNSSMKYVISAYNAGPGRKSQGPSSICSGLRVWECPFTSSAKTACSTNINGYVQTRNYVVTVSRWYNEFKSCS